MGDPRGGLLRVPYVLYRQLRWALGDRSPYGATVKVTARCNLGCRYCPWRDAALPELPTGRWAAIIADLGARGVRHLVLEGGEPTLRGDLSELCRCGQRQGMEVSIATNGTRPLDGYAPDRFLISVDGLAEAHDELRGRGSFAKLVANLRTARAPRIAVVPLHRSNRGQIRAILDFFSTRVEGFWFGFTYDYARAQPSALDRAGKQAAARELLEAMRRYRIVNTPSYLRRVATPRVCKPWLLLTVTADGVAQSGCSVSALEPCQCDRCDLPCYRELSDFADPRFGLDHALACFRRKRVRAPAPGPLPGLLA